MGNSRSETLPPLSLGEGNGHDVLLLGVTYVMPVSLFIDGRFRIQQ